MKSRNQMTADDFEALNEIQKANVCDMIAEFETHNSFTKDCLVAALRWTLSEVKRKVEEMENENK